MKKIVSTTVTANGVSTTTLTTADATLADVLNPTVPLYDTEANVARVAAYVILGKVMFS